MDAQLEELAQRVGVCLTMQKLALAVAESCTGGWVAETLTAIAGSSEWFDRGWVTYSNAAKEELLDVPNAVLARSGAVSEETARAMATGALAHSRAQVALAITGIAGPSGGTPQKPVGTVCFAWCGIAFQAASVTAHFSGDRRQVRRQSVAFALKGLLQHLRCS